MLESSHDSLVAEFRQCPLVQAWEKLGYKGKELELLCDMAMDGDRGIADQMGLTLDITKTIAAAGMEMSSRISSTPLCSRNSMAWDTLEASPAY